MTTRAASMASASACLVILMTLCGQLDARAQSERPWMEQVKATPGDPVIVAQTVTAKLPWGVWQFPGLTEPEPGLLVVTFSQTEDLPQDAVSKYNPIAKYESRDGGKTWRPSTQAYGIRPLCRRRNGDLLCFERVQPVEAPKAILPPPLDISRSGPGFLCTVRDPEQAPKEAFPKRHIIRKRAGASDWERIPVTVVDPGQGMTGHDPAGKDYAIIGHWGGGGEQILELSDGTLLSINHGFRLDENRRPIPKWAVHCIRSTDGGLTWTFHSIVAQYDANEPLHGYCEPSMTVMPDGSLLAALRTEHGWETDQRTGILYLAQSYDDGRTWSRPRAVNPFGVFPRLLALENGVTVLSFGRPGVNLLFNADGRGERWEGLQLLVNEGQRFTRTSGYTNLVPLGPDRFMVVYDQFDYPNTQAEPRKTILVREVVVSRRGTGTS